MASAKIQPKEMNFCDLGFGKLVSGIFKGLASHHLAATKNIQAQEMKMWGFEPENWSQGLVSPYLAAAGRQTNQPQEMRIWGLGWRNCSREFSGTCAPYLAAAGHQKIQPQEMRIWAWQNFPRFPQKHFSLPGPSGRGTVSKNLARIPLFCRLRKLRGATEQLLKDN